MPENLQYGEKGDRAQEIVEALDNAVSSLEESIEYINEAVEPQ